MPLTRKPSLLARIAFLLGGLATLILVGFLLLAGFTRPLNSRMPVPSPDGKYFAYFVRVGGDGDSGSARSELIIATPQGLLVARLPMPAGKIIWSNANHLVAVEEDTRQAAVVANAEGRFLVLTRFSVSQGGDPEWASDGTKLACVRGPDAGPQFAIYDIQQPQAFPVPLPQDLRLEDARVVAWSPGSERVYFLNREAGEYAIYSAEVRAGNVRTLARGPRLVSDRYPQMSPDGSRIFAAPIANAVIDTREGINRWTLPEKAVALWKPWSGDSREFYFYRTETLGEIMAHDFRSGADLPVVAEASPNGFFTTEGRIYFFRSTAPRVEVDDAGEDGGDTRGGWHQSDRHAPGALSLGRIELWPWEQTFEGLILARRDDYTRVRMGLYDPETRTIEPYVFPTDREDFRAQVRSHRLVLATVVLFTLLAGLTLTRRAQSRAVRTFSILAFLATALLCGHLVGGSELSPDLPSPYRMTREEITNLGWWMSSSLPQLIFERVRLALTGLWALVPLAALHFGFSFPNGTTFLQERKPLRQVTYAIAVLPAMAWVMGPLVPSLAPSAARYMLLIAGAVVACVFMISLTVSYRRPPDRKTALQLGWVIWALGLTGLGSILIVLVRHGEGRLSAEAVRTGLHFAHSALYVVAAWLGPAAMAYAVAARKPSSPRGLLFRGVRQILMGLPALVIFPLVWAVAVWVLTGALWVFSAPAIVVAVLLTVIAVLPFRERLRGTIDQALDRPRFLERERLLDFARSLPHTVDREALALQLEETAARSLQARWILLFVIDRPSDLLRLQPGKGSLPLGAGAVTFDLAEPLCSLLRKNDGLFEPSFVADEEDVETVLATAGDRLRKLQAEAVVGLRRNELVGMLVIGPRSSGAAYDDEELDSLRIIAQEAAAAVENIELFEAAARDRELRRELEKASEIQASLFPTRVPRLTTGQLAGCCFPARTTGGDYYDLLELPGGRVGLVMCDVSGKGMAAAQLMASLASLLRAQAPSAEDLAELVRTINREVRATSPEGKFGTLFYGLYHDGSLRLDYVNAGFNPPLIVNADGVRLLESTGLPLGLFPEITHQPRSVIVPSGTMLLVSSDGVVEARNARGETFGRDRLVTALLRELDSDADRALARVLTDVRDFEGGALLEDDQTLLLLKVHAH